MKQIDNILLISQGNKYKDKIWQPVLSSPFLFLAVVLCWLEKISQHLVRSGVVIQDHLHTLSSHNAL